MTLAVPPPARAFRADGAGAGAIRLEAEGTLQISGVPERVWAFEVSGYPVLYRWLSARRGEALDAALLRGMLDVTWRLTELLDCFDLADPILDQAAAHPLTRADLGLPPRSAGTRRASAALSEEDERLDSTA